MSNEDGVWVFSKRRNEEELNKPVQNKQTNKMTNELVKEKKSIIGWLEGQVFRDQITLVLPDHITADKMIRLARTELIASPQLRKCDPESVFGAILECSQLGLELGGVLGHAYLVPFSKRSKLICTLIIGYKGLINLAARSGKIVSICARERRKNDEFSVRFGLDPDLKHVPNDGERGEVVGVYAIAKFINGDSYFEYMSKDEIEEIKETSAFSTSSSSPWNKYYDEMAKKSCIRKLFKYLAISVEMQRAVSLDEMADAGVQRFESLENCSTIEVEVQKSSTDNNIEIAKTSKETNNTKKK